MMIELVEITIVDAPAPDLLSCSVLCQRPRSSLLQSWEGNCSADHDVCVLHGLNVISSCYLPPIQGPNKEDQVD
jgi:hypothetical protein